MNKKILIILSVVFLFGITFISGVNEPCSIKKCEDNQKCISELGVGKCINFTTDDQGNILLYGYCIPNSPGRLLDETGEIMENQCYGRDKQVGTWDDCGCLIGQICSQNGSCIGKVDEDILLGYYFYDENIEDFEYKDASSYKIVPNSYVVGGKFPQNSEILIKNPGNLINELYDNRPGKDLVKSSTDSSSKDNIISGSIGDFYGKSKRNTHFYTYINKSEDMWWEINFREQDGNGEYYEVKRTFNKIAFQLKNSGKVGRYLIEYWDEDTNSWEELYRGVSRIGLENSYKPDKYFSKFTANQDFMQASFYDKDMKEAYHIKIFDDGTLFRSLVDEAPFDRVTTSKIRLKIIDAYHPWIGLHQLQVYDTDAGIRIWRKSSYDSSQKKYVYGDFRDKATYESRRFYLNAEKGSTEFYNIYFDANKSDIHGNLVPIDNNVDVKFQLRSGVMERVGRTDWIGPDGTTDSYYTYSGQEINDKHDGHTWMQYKLYLESKNKNYSPFLENIRISYYKIHDNPPKVIMSDSLDKIYDEEDYNENYTVVPGYTANYKSYGFNVIKQTLTVYDENGNKNVSSRFIYDDGNCLDYKRTDGKYSDFFAINSPEIQSAAIAALREYAEKNNIEDISEINSMYDYVSAVMDYLKNHMGYASDAELYKSLVEGNKLNAEELERCMRVKSTDLQLPPDIIIKKTKGINPDYDFVGDCEDYSHMMTAMLRALEVSPDCVYSAYSPKHASNIILFNGKYRIFEPQVSSSRIFHVYSSTSLTWEGEGEFPNYLIYNVYNDKNGRSAYKENNVDASESASLIKNNCNTHDNRNKWVSKKFPNLFKDSPSIVGKWGDWDPRILFEDVCQ